MNYTARDQMIRIAGFSLFLGAAALMAQSPNVNPVLMTTKLLPGTAKLAMVNGHSAPTQPSWFTAGPHAVPVAVRMDPAFGPPTSTYGAAPMAVQFTFGRK